MKGTGEGVALISVLLACMGRHVSGYIITQMNVLISCCSIVTHTQRLAQLYTWLRHLAGRVLMPKHLLCTSL